MTALSLVVPVLFTARPLAWLITRRFIVPMLVGWWIGRFVASLGVAYVLAFVIFVTVVGVVLWVMILRDIRRRK